MAQRRRAMMFDPDHGKARVRLLGDNLPCSKWAILIVEGRKSDALRREFDRPPDCSHTSARKTRPT
jgi:hypothetical protein